MKIKSKIYLGIIFLFSEFILITTISTYYIYHISNQTNLIMTDNNLSVKYAMNMLDSIEKINSLQTAATFNPQHVYDKTLMVSPIDDFEKNLISEEKNITEIGEKDIIQSVRMSFEKLKNLLKTPSNESLMKTPNLYFSIFIPIYSELKIKLNEVSNINMQAMERKTLQVKKTVTNEFNIILIISSICFLVTFSFIFNFPGYIARPIMEMTNRIKEIFNNNNYTMRLNHKSNDEIGELAEVFNKMISILEEHEKNIIEMKRRGLSIDSGNVAILTMHLESIKNEIVSLDNLNLGRLLTEHTKLLEKIKSEIEKSSKLLSS